MLFELNTGGKEHFNSTHVKLESDGKNVPNTTLVIEKVKTTDQNQYDCMARNEANDSGGIEESVQGTFVHVNCTFLMFLLSFCDYNSIFVARSSSY